MASAKRERQRANKTLSHQGTKKSPTPERPNVIKRLFTAKPTVHQGKYEAIITSDRFLKVTGLALGALLLKNDFRGLLPEPVDIGGHVGNMAVSTGFGVAAAGIGTPELMDRFKFFTEHPGRMRAGMIAGAATIGLAVNALVETKTGIDTGITQFLYEDGPVQSLNRNLTPDTLDMAYGVVGAALGTYAVKIRENPYFQA